MKNIFKRNKQPIATAIAQQAATDVQKGKKEKKKKNARKK
jgi:hypothetical protein